MDEETDVITLRPRLTIFSDVHPELYAVFKKTPQSRHNAMVLNMLVRLATLEKYVGQGNATVQTGSASVALNSGPPIHPAKSVRKDQKPVPGPEEQKVMKEPASSSRPNIGDMSSVLGGMLEQVS
ncbi:hypothetical protein V8Z74_15160 [Comamonas sp. w2-DMI]|uniref:hypothetical protein n=1 Tax=Comamonas sp. w2-DMI TaxID=3126391 RepID=UPI0032E47957